MKLVYVLIKYSSTKLQKLEIPNDWQIDWREGLKKILALVLLYAISALIWAIRFTYFKINANKVRSSQRTF